MEVWFVRSAVAPDAGWAVMIRCCPCPSAASLNARVPVRFHASGVVLRATAGAIFRASGPALREAAAESVLWLPAGDAAPREAVPGSAASAPRAFFAPPVEDGSREDPRLFRASGHPGPDVFPFPVFCPHGRPAGDLGRCLRHCGKRARWRLPGSDAAPIPGVGWRFGVAANGRLRHGRPPDR